MIDSGFRDNSPSGRALRVAYLVPNYPAVSHTFIRREITELERDGLNVLRFSLRPCTAELVDDTDSREQARTEVVLECGVVGHLLAAMRIACFRPQRFLQALRLATRVGWGSDRGFLRHMIYLAEACVLRHRFRQAGADHVHCHFGTNATTIAMLCRMLGGPSYSFTVHGPEEFDLVTLIAIEQKIRRAAFVVAISSFGRSQLMRRCDRSLWSRIHVVHCGVDDAWLRQTHHPIPDESRLVCVGRLCEQKGHLLLVEAASRLASNGLAFRLVLVGDGELRREIEQLIVRHRLRDHVEITGWADGAEVRRQLLRSRALVLPSFAEGLPVVIMESLAMARPVISTYVAGIPELVEPGTNGWLVPAGSVDELTRAIHLALTSPVARLQEMGKAGAARVRRQHDTRVEAAKLAELFRQTVALSMPRED